MELINLRNRDRHNPITNLFPNGPIYDSPYPLMDLWNRVVVPICQITFMDTNP